jgi:hypothetical protein
MAETKPQYIEQVKYAAEQDFAKLKTKEEIAAKAAAAAESLNNVFSAEVNMNFIPNIMGALKALEFNPYVHQNIDALVKQVLNSHRSELKTLYAPYFSKEIDFVKVSRMSEEEKKEFQKQSGLDSIKPAMDFISSIDPSLTHFIAQDTINAAWNQFGKEDGKAAA